MYVKDGQAVYFKDITGSIAGTDEYLLFVWLLIPSALVRLFRAGARPAILEIVLFCFAIAIVYVGYSSIGFQTLVLTVETTGDIWIALIYLASGVAMLFFTALAAEGWLLRRRS